MSAGDRVGSVTVTVSFRCNGPNLCPETASADVPVQRGGEFYTDWVLTPALPKGWVHAPVNLRVGVLCPTCAAAEP